MRSLISRLDEFRLPDYPNAPLTLDQQPLVIINTTNFDPNLTTKILTPALGISTILYNFHPNALAAFLDIDAWFSMTWSLSTSPPKSQSSDPSSPPVEPSKLEIGRITNQITFGTLSHDGETWTLMLTFNMVLEGEQRGKWIPNPKESMQGERDVTDPEEIEQLARDWVTDALSKKVWQTGKGLKHTFCVEYAPMDVWGDGIPMSPHWLYSSLDLSKCTTCATKEKELQRCGRCGTATYCSDACQKKDWAVHKHVCTMSMEDRGQALRVSEKGGLIGWDVERTFAVEGEGVESGNPNLGVGVLKRSRAVVEGEEDGEQGEEGEREREGAA